MAWIVSDDEPPRLFSIGGSTSVTEWDLKTCLPISNYQANAGVIWSLAASPDNKKLAVGCEDGSVILLDVSGGPGVIEQERILQRQSSRILCLAWNGNDKLVGGLADARISVWSTKRETNGRILATVKVDKSKQRESTLVWSIKMVNERVMVSGDSTGSVKFWDAQKFTLLQSFSAQHAADVLCLAVDTSGRTVYSAGVDRKIMCYQVVNRNSGRWSAMGSSMVHGHDVRALALHEAATANFLVSGGVERTLVINDLNDFMFGSCRKLPITPQRTCVAAVPRARLLVMWNAQTVKLWYVGELAHVGDGGSDDSTTTTSVAVPVQGKKLVCRMTLTSDENITDAAISADGSLLAVSTIVETKLFALSKVGVDSVTGIPTAYKVHKLAAHDLEDQGAQFLRVVERNGALKLLVVSPESDVILYDVDATKGVDLDSDPIELNVTHPQTKKAVNALNYSDSVSHVEVSPDGHWVALSRYSGIVDLFDISKAFDEPLVLKNEDEDAVVVEGSVLGRFPGLPTALSFTTRATLVIVTAEVRVFEYSIQRGEEPALTAWSRANSELLPQELSDARDKCRGVFYDPEKAQRLWLWAGTWLAFLDTSVDIPVKRVPKRLANGGGKRHEALGLVADEDDDEIRGSVAATTDADGDVNMDSDKNKKKQPEIDDAVSVLGRRAFWITYKYRPILYAGTFGSKEMVVVERPLMDLKLPPAFWSNHKISF